MRVEWALAVTLVAAGCESQDDDNGDDDTDGSPDDTDDTDTVPVDTDTDGEDTDTDLPPEDFCAFTQCGGDVVGTWSFVGVCFDLPNPWDACPTVTEVVDNVITGTWVFDAAGTYEVTGSYSYSNTATIPAECNTEISDCSEWVGFGFAGGIECTGDVAVACTCETFLPLIPLNESGMWDYNGENVRTFSYDQPVGKGGPIPTEYEICVDGDRLQLDQSFFFHYGFTLER